MTRPAALALASALMLASCASEVDFIAVSYDAADTLIEDSNGRIEAESPLVYTTFVPVGSLEQSTMLGRILAEETASRFVQRGYPVVEVRLREGVAVKPGGPFVLSDDAHEVARRVLAKAALVGSYAATSRYVLLNVRLIDVSDGIVLASYDTKIPIGRVEALLINGGAPLMEAGTPIYRYGW
jgi:TolB-like protein